MIKILASLKWGNEHTVPRYASSLLTTQKIHRLCISIIGSQTPLMAFITPLRDDQ